MINFIKNYINNLDIVSMNNWLKKEDITLDKKELYIVFNHLKNDWYNFLYIDSAPILNILKEELTKENYLKLKNLYTKYYDKYKSYL